MTEYLSAAETAKLIRRALARAFPGVAFYVNSKSYSGGSDVRVEWMDGPTEARVKEIVMPFEGKSFDGSIDMAYSMDFWLLPDGSAQFGQSTGTSGSMGMVGGWDNPAPCAGARLVSGSSYIFTERAYSRALVDRVGVEVRRRYGCELPAIEEWSWWTGTKERGTKAAFAFDFYHQDVCRWCSEALRETEGGANGKAG